MPADENKPFDVVKLIDALVDAGSFLEVHKRWAKELVVGYARIDGRVVGIVANQPKQRGGVLFVDSSDKAARFIWTCNAFNIPLLFLADVPGLHDRHRSRAPGHHPRRREDDLARCPRRPCRSCRSSSARHTAPASTRWRARRSTRTRASRCPARRIAVMGPQAAINAVFYNQVQAIEDADERAALVEKLRAEYAEEIDILHLASELVVDAVVQPEDLRAEIARRFRVCAGKARDWPAKHNPVTPV